MLTLLGSEHHNVHWVKSIVEETYTVVEFNEERELSVTRRPFQLGLVVLHICCRVIQGNTTHWQFVNNLGISLGELYENAHLIK